MHPLSVVSVHVLYAATVNTAETDGGMKWWREKFRTLKALRRFKRLSAGDDRLNWS